MSLYEPVVAKIEREEQRKIRKQKRQLKSAFKQAEKEKYQRLYKQELAKERAKLKAEKERDIEVYKTKLAIERAHTRARAKVKPFTPKTLFTVHPKRLTPEQKRRLKKAGATIGKTSISIGKSGLNLLDKMFSDAPTKRKPTKRKTYKRKPTKRKTYKRKPTKRKVTSRKRSITKGKTYYCRKCHKRHSYRSKVGRTHRK